MTKLVARRHMMVVNCFCESCQRIREEEQRSHEKVCRNCKSWEEILDRNCLCHDDPGLMNKRGNCLNEKIQDVSEYREYHGPELDEATYSDSEMYQAHFETGPDFGCIHFEAKAKG